MAYELIPGVRQDHRGRFYQHGRYPNGKLIMVPVKAVPLSARSLAQLEPVTAETQSTLRLNKDIPADEPKNVEWVEKALQQGSLFKSGDRYTTLKCFQGSAL